MSKLNDLLRKLADAENMGPYVEPDSETQKKILEFISNNASITDSDFHEFVESLQIEPPQAETFVYRTLQKYLTQK